MDYGLLTFNSGILWRLLLFNLNKSDSHFTSVYANDNNKNPDSSFKSPLLVRTASWCNVNLGVTYCFVTGRMLRWCGSVKDLVIILEFWNILEWLGSLLWKEGVTAAPSKAADLLISGSFFSPNTFSFSCLSSVSSLRSSSLASCKLHFSLWPVPWRRLLPGRYKTWRTMISPFL